MDTIVLTVNGNAVHTSGWKKLCRYKNKKKYCTGRVVTLFTCHQELNQNIICRMIQKLHRYKVWLSHFP